MAKITIIDQDKLEITETTNEIRELVGSNCLNSLLNSLGDFCQTLDDKFLSISTTITIKTKERLILGTPTIQAKQYYLICYPENDKIVMKLKEKKYTPWEQYV